MFSVNSQIYIFPSWVIALVLGAGLFFAIIRPLWGFLFSIAIPISMAIPTLVFTRYASVGAYFNLLDACMIVTLSSFVLKQVRGKSNVHIPMIAVVMLMTLGIGIIETSVRYGITYESLRALRWAINTPIYLIVAANMIRDQRDVRMLLRTTFIGAVIAETQHLFFVLRSPALGLGEELGQIRSSMFQTARSESWLIAGPYMDRGQFVRPVVQVCAALLFAAALISTQTRTVALGVVGGMLMYSVVFSSRGATKAQKRYLFSIGVVLLLVFLVLPLFKMETVTEQFAERFESLMEPGGPPTSDLSRVIAFRKESGDWITGGPFVLLFGNGLDYFSHVYDAGKQGVFTEAAWGHLGYVTYLSQLGLLGFVVYAIAFPLIILRRARRVFNASFGASEVHYLAGLTGAVFLYCAVAFISSGSFLVTDVLSGIYGGAIISFCDQYELRASRGALRSACGNRVSLRSVESGWRLV